MKAKKKDEGGRLKLAAETTRPLAADALPLPEGWTWTTIGDACNVVMGQSPPSDTYNSDKNGLPFYQGKTEFGDLYPIPVKWCSRPNKIAEAGDVLISVRAPVGPTNLCTETSCIGRGLAAIRPAVEMPSKYLLYALRHFENELAEKATGTTFSAISGATLRNQRFPLAPLAEQRRIVAAIESLFTKLDAGVAALQRAQANLRRYKASVLKAACEGRLAGGDDAPERPVGAIHELPLPEGWRWATVGGVTLKMQYGTSEKANEDSSGIPVLRMGNIQDGELSFEKLKYLPEDTKGVSELMLESGDILFNRTNSAELVGKTAVYRIRHPSATFASYIIRVKTKPNAMPEFVSFYINSLHGRKYIASVVSQQVGQANVNGTKLSNMPLPLPPLAEQRRIVAEVERRLSVVAALEATLAHNLARAEKLRQAILKQAFAGRLVGQNLAGRGNS